MPDHTTPPEEHTPGDRSRLDSIQLDWQDEDRPTLAIVQAVAALRNVDVHSLPPLYDSVNPEALEELLIRNRPSQQNGTVITFRYADCTVTIGADGDLMIRDNAAELS